MSTYTSLCCQKCKKITDFWTTGGRGGLMAGASNKSIQEFILTHLDCGITVVTEHDPVWTEFEDVGEAARGNAVFDASDIGCRASVADGGPEYVRQQLIEFMGHACVWTDEQFPVPASQIRRAPWPLPQETVEVLMAFLDRHSDGVRWRIVDGSLVCEEAP